MVYLFSINLIMTVHKSRLRLLIQDLTLYRSDMLTYIHLLTGIDLHLKRIYSTGTLKANSIKKKK